MTILNKMVTNELVRLPFVAQIINHGHALETVIMTPHNMEDKRHTYTVNK